MEPNITQVIASMEAKFHSLLKEKQEKKAKQLALKIINLKYKKVSESEARKFHISILPYFPKDSKLRFLEARMIKNPRERSNRMLKYAFQLLRNGCDNKRIGVMFEKSVEADPTNARAKRIFHTFESDYIKKRAFLLRKAIEENESVISVKIQKTPQDERKIAQLIQNLKINQNDFGSFYSLIEKYVDYWDYQSLYDQEKCPINVKNPIFIKNFRWAVKEIYWKMKEQVDSKIEKKLSILLTDLLKDASE